MLELDKNAPNICAEKAHAHGASDMTHAFSHTLEEEQLKRIRASPVISVGCDETTDVSTQSALIVYIYYLHEGEPAVEFFTLRRLGGRCPGAPERPRRDQRCVRGGVRGR